MILIELGFPLVLQTKQKQISTVYQEEVICVEIQKPQDCVHGAAHRERLLVVGTRSGRTEVLCCML